MTFPGLHSYPTDPLPAVRCLLDYFRGAPVDAIEVGHAAWHLIGYAYSMADTHPTFSSSPARAMTQDELIRQVETIEAQHQTTGFSAAGFDWLSLAMALIELLKLLRP